jgi:hypothetical protein
MNSTIEIVPESKFTVGSIHETKHGRVKIVELNIAERGRVVRYRKTGRGGEITHTVLESYFESIIVP